MSQATDRTKVAEIVKKLQSPDWWIEKCISDLYFLCRNVLVTLTDTTYGYKDLYKPTHEHICQFVDEYAQPGHYVLVLTPRGWVKSYMITVGWSLKRMLKNLVEGKKQQQIISNATLGNSMNFLERIKQNIKHNDLIKGLFKEWIPGDPDNQAEKWKLEEIQIGGNYITTGSVEGNLVSQHYDVMINDDLVNRDNTLTREQLLKTLDWWKLARSLLEAKGLEINIGTRWNYDDLYGYFIENFIKPPDLQREKPVVEFHKDNYHVLRMSCWEKPLERRGSTFPSLFPEEKLKALMNEQGDRFPGQYENDPLASARNTFRSEWMQRWTTRELPEVRYTQMLIDPSGKAKDGGDFTGVVVVHLCPDKKGYVEYGKRHLITDRALADWIIINSLKFRPDMIGIEDNKYGTIVDLLELLIAQYVRMRKLGTGQKELEKEDLEYLKTVPYIMVELNPRGRVKLGRITNLAGRVESGDFLFPYGGAEDLEDEMIRHPSMRDDVLDAFAYVLDNMRFPLPTDQPKLAPEHRHKEEKEEDSWDEIKEDFLVGRSSMADDSDLW